MHMPQQVSSCPAPGAGSGGCRTGSGPNLHGMLLGLEAVTVNAPLFQGPDDSLDHPVLLWAIRRDELLLQTVAAYQPGVMATGKDQAIIRT